MLALNNSSARMRARVRAARLASLPLAALLLLGGCSKKPGGQVVAVVNSEEITQPEIRAEAAAAGVPSTQDFQAYAPAVLQRVIDRNLLADYAEQQGLNRGPEYVARRRQLEQALLANLALRKIAGTPTTPSPAAVQAFVQQNPSLFAQRQRLTLDQIRFATPTDPQQLKALMSLGSLSAIEARLRSQGTRMARGIATMDTGTVDSAVARQVTGLPNGQIFDLSAEGTTYVSAITARAPVPGAQQNWAAAAAPMLQRESAQKKVADTLAQLRKSAKIQYDPAFEPAKAK